MKDMQEQGQQLTLTNHINSIKKVTSDNRIVYFLSLIPTPTQIKVLKYIGEKNQIPENLLRDEYYCQEQKIGKFMYCFSYEQISLNIVHECIQSITEKLLKACTLVFFTSVIPFLYVIIGISFFQFIFILISRSLIQHWLQPKKIIKKAKMRVLMLFWILISLLIISSICAFLYELRDSEDKNTFFRLISIIPFQIWMLFYQIYWINYYEQYLKHITQYSKDEIKEFHKNKLLTDFYLLQKHFQCHLNSCQKFYLVKKNPQCKISEEALKFAMTNVEECEKFYKQNIQANHNKKDVEDQQSCEQATYSEKVLNKMIANAVLFEIKDQLASSEALNQQELASIIETNKQKKQIENPTMLPPLLSHRSSINSNFPQTPSCYSPAYTTNRNFLQIDNQLYLNLTSPSDVKISEQQKLPVQQPLQQQLQQPQKLPQQQQQQKQQQQQ